MFYTINQFLSILVNSSFKRFLFAIVFGLMFATTLPFIGFEPYAWLALVPLLILIKSSDSYFSALWESLVFLMVYNLASFSWLIGLHPLTWHGFSIDESLAITAAAWLVPALFHSLILVPFIILAKIFYDFRADNRSHELDLLDMCILAFAWVCIEHKLLTNLGPDFGIFSIPLNLLAYSQYQNKVLIQVANAIGSVGLEFFIVLVNLFISNFFNIQKFNASKFSSGLSNRLNVKKPFFGIQNPTENLQYSIVLTLLLSGILVYGIFELESNKAMIKAKRKQMKSFAIVQGNFATSTNRGTTNHINQIISLEYQLSKKIKNKKDILLWTEGAVPMLEKDLYRSTLFNDLLLRNNILAYGTYTERDEKIYNSIETLEYRKAHKSEPAETIIHEYHKSNLVPFGEYTPMIDYLPRELKSLAESTVGNGFARSTEPTEPTKTSKLKIAYSICFELLFSDLIREQTSKDAEIIINLNDLSWFTNLAGGNLLKKQFLAVAVFRAVENKKDLLLAGNCGFSALIDATGKIQLITQGNKIAILQGYFMPRRDKSIYSLYGW